LDGQPDSVARVVAFCCQHSIVSEVGKAVDLVKQAFPLYEKLEIRIEKDPEVPGDSLVIKVTVRDEVGSFVAACNRCIEGWSRAVSPQALGLISLAYDIL
jgi:hypothetical protein